MRNLLLRIVFMASLVVGLVIVPAIWADSGSGTLTPGSTACVGPIFSSGATVVFNGQVTNCCPSPKWSVWWSADGTTFTRILKTHAIALTAQYTTGTHPELFPGYFQGCVNNDTGINVNYTISIN